MTDRLFFIGHKSNRMTKEAAEELEEMGEDTSDMIMSQSKMREMIMNATKVASNNFKGVDIQTELGNYKSTFQILSEIGAIWDEIKQADLRTGDNRQNLLLEAMAGKNRANTLASVLMNNDILQSAYQDSKYNATGKATEELEKVSQSITFHLNQLTNAWQELWANAANRDVINMFIDLGTTILNLINDVGGLQSAFTLLWGGAIVKGLATANSWLVKFVRGLDAAKASSQGLGNTLSNIFTNLTGTTDSNKETRWKGLAQIQKNREQQAQQQPTTIADTASDIASATSKENKAKAAQHAAQANLEEASSEQVLQVAQDDAAQSETTETANKIASIETSRQATQQNIQEVQSLEALKQAHEEEWAESLDYAKFIVEGAEGRQGLLPKTFSRRQQKQIKELAEADFSFDTILPKMQKAGGKGAMDWTMAYVDGIEDIGEEAMKTGERIAQMGDIAGDAATGFGAIGTTLAGLATDPMTWLMAIPAVLALISTIINSIKKQQQELIDGEKEAASTWQEAKTDIDEYAQKYQELHAQLQNTNLSEEEQADIKKQIYELQKQITEEYGNAASGVSLVNGELDTQLAKLRQIKAEEARKNLLNNEKEYKNAQKEMEAERTYNMIVSRNAPVTDQAQQILDKYDYELKQRSAGMGTVEQYIEFKGDASDAEQALQELFDEVGNFSEDERVEKGLQTFFTSISSATEKNNQILRDHQEAYNAFLEEKIFANDDVYGNAQQTAGEVLIELENAVNDYNMALQSGDTSQIEKTKKTFEDLKGVVDDITKDMGDIYSHPFDDLIDKVDSVQEEAYNVKKKFDDPNTKNIVESILGSPKENKKSAKEIPDALRDAAENLLDEQRKAYDWGMKPLGINPLQGLYSQSQFGNIDMNNRPVIKWNEDYRKRFAEALESWNYAPEDGMVDTVFGGSGNFNGLEIAFTPILATEDGKLKDFMSYDAVHEYIQGLVDKATDKDGHIDAQLVLDLDAGKVKDKDIIPKQIIGAVDGIGKYSAATVGKMMHFSGTKGSISLGMEQLSQAAEKAGVDVNKVMEILRNTGNVDALAGVFDDFKYDLADIEGQLSDLPNASDDILKLADAFGITSESSQESINAVAELLGSLGYIATNSMNEAGESFDKFTQKASGWIEETSNLSSTLSKGQGFLTFTKTQDEQSHDIASEVKTLADAYKDLPGYNYASLFEETAGGIMVNAEALRALQAEEESMRHAEFYEKRQELMEKFTASSGMAAEAYRKQIEELDMLWSAYSGATSALTKYQNGHGAADYSTNYKLFRDQIFKEGDAYLESGEIGEEGFRRIAQLFSYKDLALASVDEVVEAYQKGANTMQRFFTEDPTEGVNLWQDEIMSWPEEYAKITTNAAGETIMTMTDKNLDAVAKQYGVSKDLILSLMNEMNATGSRIHFFTDGQMQQLDAVTEKAEAARQRLLEIREQGTDPALANSDILNFDINSLSADELKAKIEELQTLRANPDIDSESASVLDELLQLAIDRMDLLNGKTVEPEIEMDTDGLNQAGEIATDLNERLDQINQYRKLNYDISISGDDKVKEVSTQIASWPRAMQEAYGFEFTTNADEIAKQIEDKFPNGIQLQVNPEVGGEKSLEPNPSVSDYDLTVGADTTQAEADIAALKNDPNLSEFEMHVGTDSPQAQQDIENTANNNYTAQISTEVEPISESTTKSALSTLGDGIKTTVEAGLTKDAELESLTNGQELRGQGVVDIRVGENEAADEQAKLEEGTESPVHYEPQTEELDAAKAEAEEGVEENVKFVPENSMQDAANQAGAQQGVTTTSTEDKVINEETHTTVTTDASQLDALGQQMQSVQAMSGSAITMSVNVSGIETVTQASEKVDALVAKNGKKVNITIGGNTAAFNKTITNATTQLTTLSKKNTTPAIKADNSKLMSAASAAKSKLDTIKSKSITISAHSNGFGSILSEYRQLKSKSITLTTNKVTNITTNRKADGTAHSAGTLMSGGKAFAQGGNWGLPKAEKGALINELGSEIVVMPSGQWQILNGGDPTFANLPKGAIIFNHKQSADLLKNGYVTGSHGKLVGGSFARGTVDEDEDIDEEDLDELTGDAFALGTTEWNGELSGESHAAGGKLRKASKRSRSSSSSSKSSKSSGGHSSKSHKSKGKKGKKSKSSKSSSSSKAKDFLETLDAIEIQINRIDALFQKLDTDIGKTYTTFGARTGALTTEFSALQAEIKRVDASLKGANSSTNYLRKAADAARTAGLKKGDEGYKAGSQGASGVGLSSAWIARIQNSVNTGSYMTLNDVKDEGLWKKIQAYQTWYEKYVKLQQKKQDYINKLSQLTIQKLQLIQSQYNASLETISTTLTRNQNLLDLQTSRAADQANSYFNGKYTAYNNQIKTLQAEAKALTNALNEGVRNGTITRGSEEWTKWSNQIASINNDIIKAQKDIADTAVAQIQYVQDKWQTTLDMLETNMDTYEKWIDRFQYTQNIYPIQTNATNSNDSTLKYYETEISLNKTRMADLQAQANAMQAALNSAVNNNRIQKNSEEWKKWQTQIQQVKNEIIETQNAISQLATDKLEHIQTRWEASIDHMSTVLKRFEAFADLEETKGYDISEKYYQEQIKGNNQILDELTRKASNLQESLNEAVIHGRILTYSEEWYKWAESIEDVKNEIVSTQEEIADLNNEIRQLAWDRFERIQDQISDVVDEMDFLNGLIYENDLFEENGMVTDKGRASGGLIAQQYDLLMKEAQNYRKEILAINEDIAKDPNNQKLIKQRNDWIKSQQSVIENARKQKEAMVDLAEKGIKKQIDYMSDLIDKYEEALDKQRDQEQYAKNIADKQKSISNLEKQLRSMGGDDSEEGRARRQRLQDQLKQAREDLQDTQEDKRLSDIKDMLGDMQDKYEDVLNDRLDNIDQLFSDAITVINQNGADIAATIRAVGASVGYNLTTNINKTYEGVANTDDNSSDTALVSGTVNGNFSNGSATTLKTAQQAEADAERARKAADNTATKNIASVTTTTVKTTTTTTRKPTTTTKKATTTKKVATTKKATTTKKVTTTKKKATTTKKPTTTTRKAGFSTVGGKWYYYNSNGSVKKGNYSAYGRAIKSNASTGAVIDGIVRDSGGREYYIKGGKKQTGWQTIGGKKYYFHISGGDGVMFKGLRKVGNKTYYFNSNGTLQMKDFTLNGLKYDVASKDGHIRTAKNSKGKTVKKYAKGTKYVPKTDMYQVDEEGQEVFINSKGKIYTRLEKGAAVLPHKAALNLLDGMSNPVEFIKDHMDLRPNKSITNTTTSGDTYNNVTFNLPRVTNYSEFMREAQKDPNFTKYIQEISIGTLNGNNSLKGNSIRFK